MSAEDRCCALTGTVFAGPHYCGHPAETVDADGRPLCGVHRNRRPGIGWHGAAADYPRGTGGSWRFSKGDPR